MFCRKCGNQLPDEARFCSRCGSRTGAGAAAKPANGAAAPVAAAQKKKRSVSAKAVGIAATAAVAALAAALLFFVLRGRGKPLDLKQAYTVSLRGADGSGRARLRENEDYLVAWLGDKAGLDTEKAELDELRNPLTALEHYSLLYGMDVEGYTEKVFGKAMSEKELEAMWEELEPVVSALSELDYEIRPDSGLENGDELEISFIYDEEDMKEAGIRLQNTTWTYTVEGLDDAADTGLAVLEDVADFVEDFAGEIAEDIAEAEERQAHTEDESAPGGGADAAVPKEAEDTKSIAFGEGNSIDAEALARDAEEIIAEAEAQGNGWPLTLRPYPGGKAKEIASYRTEISDTTLAEMLGWIEDLKADGFVYRDFYGLGLSEADMLAMDAWWGTDGSIYLSTAYANGVVAVDYVRELPDLERYLN